MESHTTHTLLFYLFAQRIWIKEGKNRWALQPVSTYLEFGGIVSDDSWLWHLDVSSTALRNTKSSFCDRATRKRLSISLLPFSRQYFLFSSLCHVFSHQIVQTVEKCRLWSNHRTFCSLKTVQKYFITKCKWNQIGFRLIFGETVDGCYSIVNFLMISIDFSDWIGLQYCVSLNWPRMHLHQPKVPNKLPD